MAGFSRDSALPGLISSARSGSSSGASSRSFPPRETSNSVRREITRPPAAKIRGPQIFGAVPWPINQATTGCGPSIAQFLARRLSRLTQTRPQSATNGHRDKYAASTQCQWRFGGFIPVSSSLHGSRTGEPRVAGATTMLPAIFLEGRPRPDQKKVIKSNEKSAGCLQAARGAEAIVYLLEAAVPGARR